MPKVLIVEDHAATRNGLAMTFRDAGYEVVTLDRGDSVLRAVITNQPDIIILDVMLPGKNGLQVCRELRAKHVTTPVIMLTARGDEDDRITGLDTGADDYVRKPFSIGELLARARVQLRRQHAIAGSRPTSYRFGDVEIDFKAHAVLRDKRAVELTRKEFDLLRFLVRHTGELLDRKRILDEVWGYHNAVNSRTLDTHIMRLRQKLETDPARPRHILSVYGGGYKLVQ
jgi:DNA-binding response OmpR family regulator